MRRESLSVYYGLNTRCRMAKPLFLSLLVLTAATPLLAAPSSPLDDPTLPGSNRYERCLAMAHSRPQDALAAANAWQTAGGGDAAMHCQAIALVALRRYAEAAAKLDQLARQSREQGALRAQIYDQAGNAWLLGQQPANAESSFTSAITLSPSDPELLTDRARARAMLKNWAGADSDLSAALALAPLRADILVLRSSARHAEGKGTEARADVDRALDIKPGYAEALVERGVMKYESGDTIGAKADWQQVISDAPGTAAAAAANEHLKAMQQASSSTPPAGH